MLNYFWPNTIELAVFLVLAGSGPGSRAPGWAERSHVVFGSFSLRERRAVVFGRSKQTRGQELRVCYRTFLECFSAVPRSD